MCCVLAGIFCILKAEHTRYIALHLSLVTTYSFLSFPILGHICRKIFCYAENNSSSESYFQRVIWNCSFETPKGHGGKNGPIGGKYAASFYSVCSKRWLKIKYNLLWHVSDCKQGTPAQPTTLKLANYTLNHETVCTRNRKILQDSY